MKKEIIVAVIMIAILAGVIMMPWQAYYAIAALAGAACWVLRKELKVWGEDEDAAE